MSARQEPISNLTIRSNIYHATEPALNADVAFLRAAHDPKVLQWAKKRGARLSAAQLDEMAKGLHCMYAAPDDYPWGIPVRSDPHDEPQAICKCLETDCEYFSQCRPDFDEDELDVLIENLCWEQAQEEFEALWQENLMGVFEPASPATRQVGRGRTGPSAKPVSQGNNAMEQTGSPSYPPAFEPSDSAPSEHAAHLEDERPAPVTSSENEHANGASSFATDAGKEPETQQASTVSEASDNGLVQQTPAASQGPPATGQNQSNTIEIPATKWKRRFHRIDFSVFEDADQEKIINEPADARIIVNGGPGTGKTWTLVQRLQHLLDEGADLDSILVLTYTRAAKSAVLGGLGVGAGDVEVRTFDSFAGSLLVTVRDECPGLVRANLRDLDKWHYDLTVKHATEAIRNAGTELLSRHQHIFVDEIQDLVGDRAEMVLAIIESLPPTCGYTILGDSCQAIYDYQSKIMPSSCSSEQFYDNLNALHGNGKRYTLTVNHRREEGGSLETLFTPYRSALLAYDAPSCATALEDIAKSIKHIAKRELAEEIEQRTVKGTSMAVLTRYNTEALYISSALYGYGVNHVLRNKHPLPGQAEWIARVLTRAEGEILRCEDFESLFCHQYPAEAENADAWWHALVSGQRDTSRSRYEIADLIERLPRSDNPLLYSEPDPNPATVVVSNIHRVKGLEYDCVALKENLMKKSDVSPTEEHRVTYVGLTRARQEVLVFDLEPIGRRSHKPSKRKYRSRSAPRQAELRAIEIGLESDVDRGAQHGGSQVTAGFWDLTTPGMALRVSKVRYAPDSSGTMLPLYKITDEDETCVLGYMSCEFMQDLHAILSELRGDETKDPAPLRYEDYPVGFDNVYLRGLRTLVAESSEAPDYARKFGRWSVWLSPAISGYANTLNIYR